MGLCSRAIEQHYGQICDRPFIIKHILPLKMISSEIVIAQPPANRLCSGSKAT
jgi:hypothetical protein